MNLFSKIAVKILGLDNTDLPVEQINYLKDISKGYNIPDITKTNFSEFVENLMGKHIIDGFVVFKENSLLYSSSSEILEIANKLYDMFSAFKKENKILYFNIGSWVSMFEKEDFVYMIKSEARLSEFELTAIAKDISCHGKNVFLEEYKKIMSFVKV